jgi:glutathione S-transferase
MPDDARARARVHQVISILDNYGYRSMVWGVFTECVRAPAQGRAPDAAKIDAAVVLADKCLGALESESAGLNRKGIPKGKGF